MSWSDTIQFVDNDCSFSWNIVERLPVPRDRVVWSRVLRDDVGAVVVGSGPTDPERAGVVGLVREAAGRGLPVLGICLGHQAIGLAFGAALVRVEPAHGRRDVAVFGGSRRFPGFEGPVEVMRYHSLALDRVVPPLRVVARTADGVVMAVEHESLPVAGVQFHPDSFACPRGEGLIAAFFEGAR